MWTPPERIKHQLPEEQWPSQKQAANAKLFTALQYQALSLEQRTWVPAMVPWRATNEGEVSSAVLNWYGRFAQGQPGAIVVEATGVRDVPSGPLLRIGHDRYLEGLKSLTERVKKESNGHTKLYIQLIDFLSIRRRPPKEKYFLRFLTLTKYHRQRLCNYTEEDVWLGASEESIRQYLLAGDLPLWEAVLSKRELRDLQYGHREEVNDLHQSHIRDLPKYLPKLFAQAARRRA